jgi:hypothetical protein
LTLTQNSGPNLYLGCSSALSIGILGLKPDTRVAYPFAAVALAGQAGEDQPMGHHKGRDNVRKRASRRKKTERLALAKQTTRETPAPEGKKKAEK